MRRGGPIKRKTGMRRKSRMAQVNETRTARQRARDFGPQAEYCKTLDCCVCGVSGASVPAHVRSRGAGGRDRANVVPLCWWCHEEQHRTGIVTFQRVHDVDLHAVAAQIAESLSSKEEE